LASLYHHGESLLTSAATLEVRLDSHCETAKKLAHHLVQFVDSVPDLNALTFDGEELISGEFLRYCQHNCSELGVSVTDSGIVDEFSRRFRFFVDVNHDLKISYRPAESKMPVRSGGLPFPESLVFYHNSVLVDSGEVPGCSHTLATGE